jgi:hypothetical protein
VDCDKDKIILKTANWPGIDKSIIDFGYAFSEQIAVTKVVVPLYKKGHKAFIGIETSLLSGEVFQTGYNKQKFKVIGGIVSYVPTGGYIFRVKRVDGFNIVQMDMDAIHKGDKVLIKNRRSFRDRINQVDDLLGTP